jgi:hypothetical protein
MLEDISTHKTFTPPVIAKFVQERAGAKHLLNGYRFISHITRCADCYLRETAGDWREALIQDVMLRHPEIRAANYSDEVDRGDIFSMFRAFAATRKVPMPEREDRGLGEAILTGRVIGAEEIAKVNADKYLRA